MQAPGHFGLPTDLKRLWLQCRYTGTPAYRQSPHTTANMVAALTAQPAGEAHCGLVCIPASWVWDRNAPKYSTLPSPARANFLQWLPPTPPSSVARRCAPRLKQPAVLAVAARYADSRRSVDRPVYPCASPTAETGAVSGAAVSSPPDDCFLRSIERASSAPAAQGFTCSWRRRRRHRSVLCRCSLPRQWRRWTRCRRSLCRPMARRSSVPPTWRG